MARPSHESAHAAGTPQRQLLGAATTGNLAILERMARKLDAGRGRPAEAVEAVKDRGVGALHLAAGNGKAEACEYLVEDVRVDVDAVDIDGRTPLFWAITGKGGHADIVRYLLDHGASRDRFDKRGFTPLHEAVKIGHCEIVKLLLSRGAYVDTFSAYYGTPLHVAAQHKQDGAMKILLDHRADCNKILDSFNSPLMMAIFSRSVKCVNLLLEAGADVNGIRTVIPLQAAARCGLTDVLKPLLDAGADPNVLNEDHPLSKMSVAKLKEGDKALDKEDYVAALQFYNMAMMVDPENVDSTLIGNGGLCHLLLGSGEGALIDAHIFRVLRPDCADSCWLQGYSHVLLQDYEKACDAFLDGLKLDAEFDGIEKALREALRLLKESHTDKKNGTEVQYREAHFYL